MGRYSGREIQNRRPAQPAFLVILARAYTGQCTSEDVEGVVLHIILIVCEVVANVDQAFINLQGPQRRGSQEGFTHADRNSSDACPLNQYPLIPPELGGRRIHPFKFRPAGTPATVHRMISQPAGATRGTSAGVECESETGVKVYQPL